MDDHFNRIRLIVPLFGAFFLATFILFDRKILIHHRHLCLVSVSRLENTISEIQAEAFWLLAVAYYPK